MDTGSCLGGYDNPRMASGYAFDRPPVHPHIIRVIRERLQFRASVHRALDVGCGAGVSTAALEPLADQLVGLEPAPSMLAHSRIVAPRAGFVVGRAERLPFRAGSIDLVTAAGSLNYVDLDVFLPELARVLVRGGVLAIYDFSEGRRFRGDDRLDAWYAEFAARYPSEPGYELDVNRVDFARYGLRLNTYEEFDVAVPMTLATYVPYVMSEMRVEMAVARGTAEGEIRAWCEATLARVFGSMPRDVVFDAYVACVRRDRAV
jgi:SAM-dependent methyltransferase